MACGGAAREVQAAKAQAASRAWASVGEFGGQAPREADGWRRAGPTRRWGTLRLGRTAGRPRGCSGGSASEGAKGARGAGGREAAGAVEGVAKMARRGGGQRGPWGEAGMEMEGDTGVEEGTRVDGGTMADGRTKVRSTKSTGSEESELMKHERKSFGDRPCSVCIFWKPLKIRTKHYGDDKVKKGAQRGLSSIKPLFVQCHDVRIIMITKTFPLRCAPHGS